MKALFSDKVSPIWQKNTKSGHTANVLESPNEDCNENVFYGPWRHGTVGIAYG
jgi:phosphoribosyl-AMP cyclohydrolase